MRTCRRARLCLLALLLGLSPFSARGGEPFAWRGYYFILSRNPQYSLEDYRKILDRMMEDHCNLDRTKTLLARGEGLSAKGRKTLREMERIAAWVLAQWEGKLPVDLRGEVPPR